MLSGWTCPTCNEQYKADGIPKRRCCVRASESLFDDGKFKGGSLKTLLEQLPIGHAIVCRGEWTNLRALERSRVTFTPANEGDETYQPPPPGYRNELCAKHLNAYLRNDGTCAYCEDAAMMDFC